MWAPGLGPSGKHNTNGYRAGALVIRGFTSGSRQVGELSLLAYSNEPKHPGNWRLSTPLERTNSRCDKLNCRR